MSESVASRHVETADPSQQYYLEGCSLLKAEKFIEAIEKFGKSAELRNETTPDMYRNQGWCLFRLAEQDAFQLQWKNAEEKFQQARHFYERAYTGFVPMREQERSEDFFKRLKLRLGDCRQRMVQIDAHLDFYLRRKQWVDVHGDVAIVESSLTIEAKRASDKLVGQSKEQVKKIQTAMNSLMGRLLNEPVPPTPATPQDDPPPAKKSAKAEPKASVLPPAKKSRSKAKRV